jgi:proline iminopeptidase
MARYLADLEFLRRHFGHERWLAVGQAWRDPYHHEADRRLTANQRERRDELKRRQRTVAEEREWRVLSYLSDVGDPDRAVAIAAEFADAPYAINFDCNKALNEEEKRTVEAELLANCRALDVPVLVVHGSRDPRPRVLHRPSWTCRGSPEGSHA